MQELTDAIRLLEDGKAVGLDGVSVELFKITINGDSSRRRRLLNNVFCIWRGGKVPHHGNPDNEGPDRIRPLKGISLGAHAGKILLKIIPRCVSEYCQRAGILPEEQTGIRPNRSTVDMMFVIYRLRERRGRNDFRCMYALYRPYQSVRLLDRTLLWTELARFGVPQNSFWVICQFYDDMQACMRRDDGVYSE